MFHILSALLLQEKLQLISVLGAGLLVGTALAVIIPEGIRSLLDVPQAAVNGMVTTLKIFPLPSG